MDDGDFRPGRIRSFDDGFEAMLERTIGHDQDTVWRMLTEPQALAQWLAPGSIRLRVGGRVHIDFEDSGRRIESVVRRLDPPRLIEYSWSSGDEPDRPLTWELDPAENGTRLTLTLKLPADEDLAKACAGFDAHLEMLTAAMEGVPIGFPVDYFLKARRAYQKAQPG